MTASNWVRKGGHGSLATADRNIGAEVMGMAQVIEFYIPDFFRRKVKWIPPGQRGKLIEFRNDLKKSA
jgi:hypothetical protein